MKKIFIALAALAVVSCVKDERDPQSLVPAPDPVYDYSGLVLNELSGAGEDNEKFWELYNGGTSEVGLKGVFINKDEELAWTGVKGQTIKPGEVFAIIGAKGTTESGFSSGFSAKKTVIVELFAPDGTRLDVFQRGEKGAEWGAGIDNNTGSWSRIPNGSGKFMITPNMTPGAANNGEGASEDLLLVGNKAVEAPEEPEVSVVLNELNGNDKFIELYNNSSAAVSLKGWTMVKDDETPNWTGPDGLSIAAGGYLLLTSNETAPDYNENFNSGFSAKKTVKIELFDAEGNSVDVFVRGEKGESWGETIYNETTYSFARVPNGTGEWACADKTPGAVNGEKKADIKHTL